MKKFIKKMPLVKQLNEYRIRKIHELHKKEIHINNTIKSRKANVYVEIGVREGTCFNQINCATKVGIDPNPLKFGDSLKQGEYFYKMTSDDFFSYEAKNIFNSKTIDVALIDGLHEFNQVLNDFENIEDYISSNGVVFLHDCNPPTREADEIMGEGTWNGDVWKLAYYLKNYRKDLTYYTLDCDWGVGVVKGFNIKKPKATLEVRKECKTLNYSYLEKNRKSLLQLKRP